MVEPSNSSKSTPKLESLKGKKEKADNQISALSEITNQFEKALNSGINTASKIGLLSDRAARALLGTGVVAGISYVTATTLQIPNPLFVASTFGGAGGATGALVFAETTRDKKRRLQLEEAQLYERLQALKSNYNPENKVDAAMLEVTLQKWNSVRQELALIESQSQLEELFKMQRRGLIPPETYNQKVNSYLPSRENNIIKSSVTNILLNPVTNSNS